MPIELLLTGHDKDLGGGFVVRRLLPAAARQAVGPFLFFDHFGPAVQHPQDNHDVRPHPHIGLATVTYLFEGAIFHRDNLGSEQEITPGAINWMTAGSGIAHSERRPERLAQQTYVNHGLQLWAALPEAHEEAPPAFEHTPADAIPEVDMDGVRVRVLIGHAFGKQSPVTTFSQTLYLDVALQAGVSFVLPPLAEERAVYAVDGEVTVDGQPVGARQMAVLQFGAPAVIHCRQPTRLAVVGGAPIGHRQIWWNFVSSRKERIVQAADDWEAGRFAQVPGETEFIPLPERRFKA
ncbi:pirin family protein [Pseudorhodoferax sp. Leaf267]|uniref:pirin family protein n=1 Tax=Pseudorhodoferax sp. Leaf267 TaxID=1736316 RepID=UPI0006F86D02|nr:pirin family protein [Pseudorhodoferax sp. Leaf267]KQP15123.1 pirin [Pseudorhodoferax sp. Leaf267]